ncbi:unnamed protein product [Phytomonas sp. Hart1]|nr:unnamed protein product [Phytomonas sp. Hart1]|eukprot:CCW68353.1 unnamed protein product [Phytomonas sp. isolate Hart1]
MIEANEHLWVLQLGDNRLGAGGIGILAKALTRNIALVEVDFSDNELNVDSLSEAEEEQLQQEIEDPVFGPFYQGLEAISEVIKKNKFLRILRLCRNGIHAGEKLSLEAPDDEDDDAENLTAVNGGGGALNNNTNHQHPTRNSNTNNINGITDPTTSTNLTTPDFRIKLPEGTSYGDLTEPWQDLPLWRLVEPFRRFHKLQVLDLAGNQLRDSGARMLALALAQNHSLQVLDLTDNEIGYNGLRYLASWALSSPESVLHTLILRRNALSGTKAEKIKRPKVPKPQALVAMGAFAQAMRGNRRIRRLVLSDNHLGPALSARLLETIAHAEALVELDFANNDACGMLSDPPDTTAAQHVAPTLARRESPSSSSSSSSPSGCSLIKLNFSGNNLGAGGLEVLLSPPPRVNPEEKKENDEPHEEEGDPSSVELPLSWSLKELDLSRNRLGDALGPLGRLFAIPHPHPTGENEAAHSNSNLSNPITTFANSLIALNIAHNEITSLRELTPGLCAGMANHSAQSPFSLSLLDLSHNRLGCDEGCLGLEVPRRPTGLYSPSTSPSRTTPSPPPPQANPSTEGNAHRPSTNLIHRSSNMENFHPHRMSTGDEIVRKAQECHLASFIEACVALAFLPSLTSLDLSWNHLRRVHGEGIYRLITFSSSGSPVSGSFPDFSRPSPNFSGSLPDFFSASSPVEALVNATFASMSPRADHRPFERLQKIDLSGNTLAGPKLMQKMVKSLARFPQMAMIYLSPSEPVRASEEVLASLSVIHDAAHANGALQDVRCGLYGVGTLPAPDAVLDEKSAEGETPDETNAAIAAIRERFLLNALLHTETREGAQK